MRIAMISPLDIRVPPLGHGGTELVVGLLTDGLARRRARRVGRAQVAPLYPKEYGPGNVSCVGPSRNSWLEQCRPPRGMNETD